MKHLPLKYELTQRETGKDVDDLQVFDNEEGKHIIGIDEKRRKDYKKREVALFRSSTKILFRFSFSHED